jgi:hypothetical protein
MKLGLYMLFGFLISSILAATSASAYMYTSGDPNPYLLRPQYGYRSYYDSSMMYPSYYSSYSYRSPLYYGGYNPYYGTYGYYYSYSDPAWKYAVLNYFGQSRPGWR